MQYFSLTLLSPSHNGCPIPDWNNVDQSYGNITSGYPISDWVMNDSTETTLNDNIDNTVI